MFLGLQAFLLDGVFHVFAEDLFLPVGFKENRFHYWTYYCRGVLEVFESLVGGCGLTMCCVHLLVLKGNLACFLIFARG